MRTTLLALAVSSILAFAGCTATGTVQVNVPGGGLCESNVATAAQTVDGAARSAVLDQAIRTCRSLEQWQAAVTAYGGDAVGPDAAAYLGQRCTEATSGLSDYQLCGLLAVSLATPTPKPSPKHKKLKKTSKPKR